MIIRPCVVCGKEIDCYPSTYNKKKYCSKECRESETKVHVYCLNCNDGYSVAKSQYNSKARRFKYCSHYCYGESKKIEKELLFNKNFKMCTHCGVYFSAHRNGVLGKHFCSQRCSKEYQVDRNSPFYRDGISIHSAGYITIKTGVKKYELEHRLIMAKYVGRKLRENEVVHHIDGDRKNNNINNLLLMEKREHDALHARERHERNRTKNASSNL